MSSEQVINLTLIALTILGYIGLFAHIIWTVVRAKLKKKNPR